MYKAESFCILADPAILHRPCQNTLSSAAVDWLQFTVLERFSSQVLQSIKLRPQLENRQRLLILANHGREKSLVTIKIQFVWDLIVVISIFPDGKVFSHYHYRQDPTLYSGRFYPC